jgi:heat shock protein HtpX
MANMLRFQGFSGIVLEGQVEEVMQLIKRVLLFLVLNALVVTAISLILAVFNVQPYLNQYGLDIPSLAVFCLVWGMAGSLISLAMSRVMAKWSYGIRPIDPANCTDGERWLVETVQRICRQAGMSTMPEIGIYESDEANAFATGPSQSRALVAVSSGLFSLMNEDEIEGVLGHEITHITNGDMVTMTLLQGVVNAFAMFAARLIAIILTRNEKSRNNGAFYLVSGLLQWVFFMFGAILVATYSRHRECRADDGGAKLAGTNKMIDALEALERTYNNLDRHAQPSAQTMKISCQPQGIWKLFSTHPPLEERIARLRSKADS